MREFIIQGKDPEKGDLVHVVETKLGRRTDYLCLAFETAPNDDTILTGHAEYSPRDASGNLLPAEDCGGIRISMTGDSFYSQIARGYEAQAEGFELR